MASCSIEKQKKNRKKNGEIPLQPYSKYSPRIRIDTAILIKNNVTVDQLLLNIITHS
jgi:hypothetical protein